MTRLQRARLLAGFGPAFYDSWRGKSDEFRSFVMAECEQYVDRCHCSELAASLALDGCPARWPRAAARKGTER